MRQYLFPQIIGDKTVAVIYLAENPLEALEKAERDGMGFSLTQICLSYPLIKKSQIN